MAKTQKQYVSAPTSYDTDLHDFAAVVQESLADLFLDAHDHAVRSTAPTASEGSPGDVSIVDDGSTVRVYVKTSRGWFYSAAFTAL